MKSIITRFIAKTIFVLIMNSLASARPLSVHQQLDTDPRPSLEPHEIESLQSTLQKYEAEKKKLLIDAYGTKATKYLSAGLWGAVGLASTSVFTGGWAAPIFLGTLAYTQNELIDYGIRSIEEKRRVATQKMLSTLLHKQIRNSSIENLPPPQAFDHLLSSNPTFHESFLKLHTDEQQVLTQVAVDEMTQSLQRFGHYQAGKDALQDDEIEGLVQSIARSGIQLRSFMLDSAANMDRLSKNQEALSKEIGALIRTTESNTRALFHQRQNLSFLNEIMFGQMSTTDKIKALRAGYWGTDLSLQQKADFERKLKILKLSEDIQNNVNTYLEGSNALLKIASLAGVDPKWISKAAQFNRYVQVGGQAISLSMSGNVLGATNAVLSLFGGGRDIALERHQEIMQGLQELMKGQAMILEGINDLKRGINSIMESQQKIFISISNLAEQVRNNHLQNMEAFAVLRARLSAIQNLVNESSSLPLDKCTIFVNSKKKFKCAHGIFASYDELRKHFEDRADTFYSCVRDGLELVLSSRSSLFDARLLLQSYTSFHSRGASQSDDEVSEYLLKIYKPTVDLMNLVTEPEDVDSILNSLFLPMNRWKNILLKPQLELQYVQKSEGLQAWPSLRNRPLEAFRLLIAPQKLQEIALMVNEVVPYFPLLADFSNRPHLRSLQDLKTTANNNLVREQEALEMLQKVLGLLDIAMAQQSLLSGDILIPYLSPRFIEALHRLQDPAPLDTSHLLILKTMKPVLENNPLFSRNFMTYYLSQELKKMSAPRSTAYSLAYAQEDPTHLKTYLDLPIRKIERIGGEWMVHLGSEKFEVAVALPKPKDLEDTHWEFQRSPEIEPLLRAREIIVDQILNFDFERSASLSDTEMKVLVKVTNSGM